MIAGRPAMGKSALALNLGLQAALEGYRVGIVSLEMDRLALFDRMLSSAASVDGNKLRTGKLSGADFAQLIRPASNTAQLPLWIDDATGQTIEGIRGTARRWRDRTAPREQHPRAIVFVDYLQLIAGQRAKNVNRTEEVGTFSSGLKNLSRELKIPVIALAQLNRAVEARSNKRPALSDLRESGAIEQDADVVAFLHRDSLYDDKADPEKAELFFEKNRNGPTGRQPIRWEARYTRYSDEVTP